VSTVNLSQKEHTLGVQIGNLSRILDGLEKKLADLDAELDSHSSQRAQYNLLGTILGALDQLDQAGAADLFWDSKTTGYDPDNQLRRVRNSVAAFEHKIGVIEGRRGEVQAQIKAETDRLRALNHDLAELEEEAERLRNEFPIYRNPADIPYRPIVMPWAKGDEDDRRYRKIFLLTLLFSFLFSSGLVFFKPAHEKKQEEELPEHIAELVVKKKEEPKPVEKKPQEKSDATTTSNQQAAQQNADRTPPPPGTTEAKDAARASASTKGVLALKNDFAGLIDNSEQVKMGASGRVSDTGQVAAGEAAQRALIVSQASGGAGSGGINTSAVSRAGTGGGMGGGGTGSGGGGQSITGSGVKVARVQSTTSGGVIDDRPLSKGAGPSRTDEEIQIVFDRYKSALYRIYNRELRNNPSLRGKMVLRLTIEPDGRVSACSVKSTDLASPALSTEIVERVLKFTFGAKEGVPATTILYPIDFLPAS
jgi:hypothetical protein